MSLTAIDVYEDSVSCDFFPFLFSERERENRLKSDFRNKIKKYGLRIGNYNICRSRVIPILIDNRNKGFPLIGMKYWGLRTFRSSRLF